MIKLSFIFIVLGVVALVSNAPQKQGKHPFDLNRYQLKGPSYFPLSVHCEGAKTGTLNFRGRVVAHKDFFSKDLKDLVEGQLKYIDGFVDYADHSKIRFVPHHEKTLRFWR